MIEYRTISKAHSAEIIIEKSRFIGYAAPVSSEKEAIEFIEKIKKKHYDATHNVYAYVVGLNNDIQRYNDDGEPSGTAGVPILEVIKKEDLRNVVIVVTRYFGGIKLGAGGLIRAYTKGAKIALNSGLIIKKKLHKMFKVEIEYSLLGKVENELNQAGYIIKEILYDQLVCLFIYVPINQQDRFNKQIIQWTNARCKLEENETHYLTVQ